MFWRSILSAVALVVLTPAAHAQSYPTKPIRLVVPLAPGGATDILARVLAQRMAEQLGQPVVVDNRTGAGGNIGNRVVARSAPDGYTLLMTAPPLVINPALDPKVGYDPVRDFTPISLVASVPVVLVVHPSVPAKNLKGLIALAKASPAKYNFSSSGVGGTNHVAGVLFAKLSGIDILHVPYKGSAPAMAALLSGEAHMQFSGLPPLLPAIKSGKVRPIAVAGAKRATALPELPTMSEAGLPGFDASSWQGLSGPAKLPAPILTRLHRVVAGIVATPDVSTRIVKLGADPVGSSPAEFARFIRSEFDKWVPIIRRSRAGAQ